MPSKALEVNIASSQVDVTIDQRYEILKEVMENYYGLKQGLETFLEEICHPYKNWGFIVKEARAYALNYFSVLKNHPKGPEAARLYAEAFNKDPDFYSFLNTLEVYRNTFDEETWMMLSTDSDFLRYLKRYEE